MEQKAKNLSKNDTVFSVQCILLTVIYVAMLSWIVFGLGPIQKSIESMVPLDFLYCFVFMLDILCSNSAFRLLLCNVIIGALMALSKSSESHDFYRAYFKEIESRRKQAVFAEPSSTGIKWVPATADIIQCTEICCVENVPQLEIEGGNCCSDLGVEKSVTKSSWTVVQYHPVDEFSDEEFKEKCDDFIAKFHCQMSLQDRQS